MKSILVIIAVFTCSLSYGQTNMFWNHYSNNNPAMSGFEYERHAAVSAREIWNWNKGIESVQANYNQRILGQHGVGINFNGSYTIFARNSIVLNYNYQFDLGKAGKLSTGIGVGVSNARLRKQYFDILDSGQVLNPSNDFLLNIGVAYSWKNLVAGINTTDLTVANTAYVNPPNYRPVNLNAFVSYDFRIRRNFELTPRLNYLTSSSGILGLTTNLTATFSEKYAVGISYNPNNYWGVNLGWDIKTRFRVAYMYSQRISGNDHPVSSVNRMHEINLSYIIKKRRNICGMGGSPR